MEGKVRYGILCVQAKPLYETNARLGHSGLFKLMIVDWEVPLKLAET